ncbi:MAG: hypothetical protein JO337_01450 [Acidimicrobiales bacterium]|nr:hypothetical protein [Acidimicrobiales bacterium]
MSRRIDIELTSARPDGTWTWRAAGAREPKGVVDGGLLPTEAKPGDVLKAEAEFELEGITIIAVAVAKSDNRPEPQRIEIVGSGRPEPGVTTQLVGRSSRRPGERQRERDEGNRRQERTAGRPQTRRPRREEGQRPERDGGGTRPGRPGAPTHSGATGSTDTGSPDREQPETGRGRPRGAAPESPRPRRAPGEGGRSTSRAERVRAPRLNPGSAHRTALMESLAPEQQAVAEQVLRGGIPAVRTALHLEREKAQAEGRAAPNTEELIAMAEQLLPRVRAAEWRDRAEAAASSLDHISMRDLRSVVAGADLARDDETRALAANLREALEGRVNKLDQDWAKEITAHLDSGKVVRALRLSARPPEPSARLDTELAQQLATAAGKAMTPETVSDLWAAILEAAAESPVRRSIVPTGLPESAPPELKRAAHQLSGTIPALAKLLGVTIPPPPAPMAPRRRTDAPAARPGRKGGGTRSPREARHTGDAGPMTDPGQPTDPGQTAEAGPQPDQ